MTTAMTRLLPREKVEAKARRFGVVRRQRKIDVFALVWSLALGFQLGDRGTIEALRRIRPVNRIWST